MFTKTRKGNGGTGPRGLLQDRYVATLGMPIVPVAVFGGMKRSREWRCVKTRGSRPAVTSPGSYSFLSGKNQVGSHVQFD